MADSGIDENGLQCRIFDVGADLFREKFAHGRKDFDTRQGASFFSATCGEEGVGRTETDDSNVGWIWMNERWKCAEQRMDPSVREPALSDSVRENQRAGLSSDPVVAGDGRDAGCVFAMFKMDVGCSVQRSPQECIGWNEKAKSQREDCEQGQGAFGESCAASSCCG